MLLHINALKVVAVSCNEKARFNLDTVQISPDGSTAATDGRRLAKWLPEPNTTERLRAVKDYPDLPGLDVHAPLGAPVVVEADIVDAIIAAHKKAVKALKGKYLSWDDYVAVDATTEPGTVILAVTDLKNPTILRSKAIENFPPADQIMAGTEDFPFVVAFRAEYLRDVAALAMQMGGGHDRLQMLCLHLKDGKTRAVFRTHLEDSGNLFALVMPLKTPEQQEEDNAEYDAYRENELRDLAAEHARRDAELAAQDAAADAVAA